MTYPIKIGDHKELKKFGDLEMHEFLVAAGGKVPAENRLHVPGMPFWLASAAIVGFIDLTTGRRRRGYSEMVWKETFANHSTEDYFKAGTIYRIKGYVKEHGTEITVAEILFEGESDEQLEQILKEFWKEWNKVSIVRSDIIGDLEYDDGIYCYVGKFNWLGKEIKIEIAGEEDEISDVSLAAAEELCRNCAEWDRKFKEALVRDLLYDANNIFLDTKISGEELISRLPLSDIRITCGFKGGTFEASTDDDDEIFDGACIYIHGNLEDGVEYATTEY
jgi:hypothetical protein